MLRLKAQVKDGRLTLDEPTDLPEGEVVYLQAVDGLVLVDRDELDVDERAALHAELEASIAESDAGQTEDFANSSPGSASSGEGERDELVVLTVWGASRERGRSYDCAIASREVASAATLQNHDRLEVEPTGVHV